MPKMVIAMKKDDPKSLKAQRQASTKAVKTARAKVKIAKGHESVTPVVKKELKDAKKDRRKVMAKGFASRWNPPGSTEGLPRI